MTHKKTKNRKSLKNLQRYVGFKLTNSLYSKLVTKSDLEGVSVSNIIRHILEKNISTWGLRLK